jgi:hypothetical protein
MNRSSTKPACYILPISLGKASKITASHCGQNEQELHHALTAECVTLSVVHPSVVDVTVLLQNVNTRPLKVKVVARNVL